MSNFELSRRRFLGNTALLAGAFALPAAASAATEAVTSEYSDLKKPLWTNPPLTPGVPGKDYTPVVTLNGSSLPFRIVNSVKVFHLTCEEVDHIFVPKTEFNQECRAKCWGFNGKIHGPTIECVQGDRVRIYVTNKLPEATAIHWHGLIIPNGMDGVGGLTQVPIEPGQTFKYEFTVWQQGTFMYHSHHDEMTQMQLGMIGLFVIHPRTPEKNPPQRDYAYILSEWKIVPGTSRPDPNEMMEFNMLTLNGKAFPGTAPMLAKVGDKVRIRIGNLSSMDHHSMHIHGHAFNVVATDGGKIPQAGQWPEVTVLVPVGSTRTVEFIADNPGDWAFHCHMFHHVMNQMGHGQPNMIGVVPGDLDHKVKKFMPGYMTMGQDGMADMGDMGMKIPPNSVPMVGARGPYGYITMGGLYTNLKVREDLADLKPEKGEEFSYGGWYKMPPGTQAQQVSEAEMQRDLG
jgi:FtsP/CotA-like multicopper oxidase with cupredoxin domain